MRVTRMGVFVGEVASPHQLAKLGVPVAELVEENQCRVSLPMSVFGDAVGAVVVCRAV